MRIAALYDIHGNLPAFNAVLAELEQVRPDLIVLGGGLPHHYPFQKRIKLTSVSSSFTL